MDFGRRWGPPPMTLPPTMMSLPPPLTTATAETEAKLLRACRCAELRGKEEKASRGRKRKSTRTHARVTWEDALDIVKEPRREKTWSPEEESALVRMLGAATSAHVHQLRASLKKKQKTKRTRSEERKLKYACDMHGGHEWTSFMPDEAMESLRYYQQHLNSTLTRGSWTQREDDLLGSLITKMRNVGTETAKGGLPAGSYQRVASQIPGRTGDQCRERWVKSNLPTTRKGPWSPTEDARISLAKQACGDDWWRIRAHIPTRTDAQCREKWTNVLDPNISHAKWTEDEDKLLTQTVLAFGIGSWSRIAATIPWRTDNQCLRRWQALQSLQHHPSNMF